jgi:chromosome partitioning protein
VGKTTIAINLAEQARLATIVLDLDPQASATRWKDARGAEVPPDVVAAQASRLPGLLADAERQGCDLVVIDSAPNADSSALAAAKAADLILVPCRPSAFDLGAIEATLSLAEIAAKPRFVVLNAAPPRSTITGEAASSLDAAGVKLAPVRLHQRMAYVNPLAAGRSAVEWEPRGKAAEELRELWVWVCTQLGMKAYPRAGIRARAAA